MKSTEIAQMRLILKSLNPVWLSLITKIDKIEVCKNKSARATRAATASLPSGLQQKKQNQKRPFFQNIGFSEAKLVYQHLIISLLKKIF